MSFSTIFKKVVKVVAGVEHAVSPFVQIAVPGAGPALVALDNIFQGLQTSIAVAEVNNPVGNGEIKELSVTNDFQAGLDFTQTILALRGERLDYDGAELKAAIKSQVDALNHMAKVKASFKVVPLTGSIPAPPSGIPGVVVTGTSPAPRP